MVFQIQNAFEVEAPLDCVWQVITDLDRYGEWNPFVPFARSTLKPADPIEMKVHVFESFAQPQTELVTVFEPGERFCYTMYPLPLGAMRSQRCHFVEALGPDRTAYRSEFEMAGWLSPIVTTLLGSRLRRGFGAMASALHRRAETLHGKPADDA
jgi:hypothetical protein